MTKRDDGLEMTGVSVTDVPKGLRVCMHVLNYAPTDGRVMREAAVLAEAGFRVTIVDTSEQKVKVAEEWADGIRVIHGREFRWLARHNVPWALAKLSRLIGCGITLLRQPADIYHAQDTTALPFSYLAARLRRARLIFDAHELPLSQPHIRRRWILFNAMRSFLRFTLPRCAAVIVVSTPIAREVQQQFGGPQPVVIRNILPYRSPVHSDLLRTTLKLPHDTRIALYQGGIQENRSLEILVHAARLLSPGIVIAIMGPADEPILRRLEHLIAEFGVGDRVRILPPVPYNELLTWTASADIGLTLFSPEFSLSIRMCLPNKLFEYLMAGLPVLSAKLEAVEEIIREFNVGRVLDSLDASIVAQTITDMLEDEVQLETWRRNALTATKQALCWEVERERELELYHEITDVSTDMSVRTRAEHG